MLVDLNTLRNELKEALPEDTVDASEVNPYLLNEVLRPMLAGKVLCYGDINFEAFETDDLRVAAIMMSQQHLVTYGVAGQKCLVN